MKAVEAVKENFYCFFWVLYTQLYTIQLGNLTSKLPMLHIVDFMLI